MTGVIPGRFSRLQPRIFLMKTPLYFQAIFIVAWPEGHYDGTARVFKASLRCLQTTYKRRSIGENHGGQN